LLHTAIDRFCAFVLASPDARLFVAFVLREMDRPTSAFETIYSGVFEPVHIRLCRHGRPPPVTMPTVEATRLRVFTLIGQMVYFRIGAAAVTRRMDWQSIGASRRQTSRRQSNPTCPPHWPKAGEDNHELVVRHSRRGRSVFRV
jgi:hypothetical protein